MIVLPNKENRVDFIRRRYYDEAATRSEIRKELCEMTGDTIAYQIVFAATKTKEKPVPKAKAPKEDKKTLTQLGRKIALPSSPEKAVLERVANPHPGEAYLVRFACPEFTSLCPVTGQPDFAHLVIDYVPGKWILESKSLKLFLASFRNHGAFHEDCTLNIAKCIKDTVRPKWLRMGGYWYPRGGIPIDVFYQWGKTPKDLWIPDQGVPPYRGRG